MLQTQTHFMDLAIALEREPGKLAPLIDLADLAQNGKMMGAGEAGIKVARRRLEQAAERGNEKAAQLLAEISQGAAR